MIVNVILFGLIMKSCMEVEIFPKFEQTYFKNNKIPIAIKICNDCNYPIFLDKAYKDEDACRFKYLYGIEVCKDSICSNATIECADGDYWDDIDFEDFVLFNQKECYEKQAVLDAKKDLAQVVTDQGKLKREHLSGKYEIRITIRSDWPNARNVDEKLKSILNIYYGETTSSVLDICNSNDGLIRRCAGEKMEKDKEAPGASGSGLEK